MPHERGKRLIHCHIGHHTANNNVETQVGGGHMMIIAVKWWRIPSYRRIKTDLQSRVSRLRRLPALWWVFACILLAIQGVAAAAAPQCSLAEARSGMESSVSEMTDHSGMPMDARPDASALARGVAGSQIRWIRVADGTCSFEQVALGARNCHRR